MCIHHSTSDTNHKELADINPRTMNMDEFTSLEQQHRQRNGESVMSEDTPDTSIHNMGILNVMTISNDDIEDSWRQ
ncbi:unnamed protein product, partial [Didymodactylos carnosus]